MMILFFAQSLCLWLVFSGLSWAIPETLAPLVPEVPPVSVEQLGAQNNGKETSNKSVPEGVSYIPSTEAPSAGATEASKVVSTREDYVLPVLISVVPAVVPPAYP
jgi:hypothetical protein